jgi:hypothetical protein
VGLIAPFAPASGHRSVATAGVDALTTKLPAALHGAVPYADIARTHQVCVPLLSSVCGVTRQTAPEQTADAEYVVWMTGLPSNLVTHKSYEVA